MVAKSDMFLFLCGIFFSISAMKVEAQVPEESRWKSVNQENGIEVFTRVGKNSDVKEIRITCTVKANLEQVVNLLSDVPLYADWVYKCVSSIRLNTVSPNETNYYIVLNFPFPLQDRDLAVQSKHWFDSMGGYHAYSVAKDDFIYKKDGYVHISEFKSTWDIIPKPNGEVFIDYKALSNPGGDLPIWLVNLAITKGPLETMKQFIHLVDRKK
jgi:hypothetical protein